VERLVIWCIHGFLGCPSDWDFLGDAGLDVRAISLFGSTPLPSIEDWASEFASRLRVDDAVVGYSLGGRLALEALLRTRCRAAVIVSAGLGVEGNGERIARREADEVWARRFESEEWQAVVEAWNAQPLFGGEKTGPVRLESSVDRAALAAALRRWSPAVQQPLAPRLPAVETPVLWIAGERDHQYVAEGRRAVDLLPRGDLWICPGSGHRVPWEQPEPFTRRICQFLTRGSHVDHDS
jgi:2-succinyl-6-hydroxy-2,4-cyclohexadiene-1-carboxylate synthase